ncbi:non-heme iron oxygenase ferredoxin subunit [candidate division KSB1 bacterium]|nr:non-heme iron oxygenase ferredoxin subunit [candidate division KSB1 bacterium]
MSEFIPVFEYDSLSPGTMHHVEVQGVSIVVVRVGDTVYALEDRCTHEEFPLSDGWLDNENLVCAFHGARFDLKTGDALSLPAYEGVKTFPVRVSKNNIEIQID